MFPFRTRSIFRSRWVALAWSAGVIWTAVSLVPEQPNTARDGTSTPETDAFDAPVAEEQLRQTEALLQKLAR